MCTVRAALDVVLVVVLARCWDDPLDKVVVSSCGCHIRWGKPRRWFRDTLDHGFTFVWAVVNTWVDSLLLDTLRGA